MAVAVGVDGDAAVAAVARTCAKRKGSSSPTMPIVREDSRDAGADVAGEEAGAVVVAAAAVVAANSTTSATGADHNPTDWLLLRHFRSDRKTHSGLSEIPHHLPA